MNELEQKLIAMLRALHEAKNPNSIQLMRFTADVQEMIELIEKEKPEITFDIFKQIQNDKEIATNCLTFLLTGLAISLGLMLQETTRR